MGATPGLSIPWTDIGWINLRVEILTLLRLSSSPEIDPNDAEDRQVALMAGGRGLVRAGEKNRVVRPLTADEGDTAAVVR